MVREGNEGCGIGGVVRGERGGGDVDDVFDGRIGVRGVWMRGRDVDSLAGPRYRPGEVERRRRLRRRTSQDFSMTEFVSNPRQAK